MALLGVFPALFACKILKDIYRKVVIRDFEDWSEDRGKDINLKHLQRQYFARGNNEMERNK